MGQWPDGAARPLHQGPRVGGGQRLGGVHGVGPAPVPLPGALPRHRVRACRLGVCEGGAWVGGAREV